MITGITWKTDPATLAAQRKSREQYLQYFFMQCKKAENTMRPINVVNPYKADNLKDANDHSKYDYE